MKTISISVNQNNQIENYAIIGEIDNGITVELPKDFSDENYKYWRLVNGELVYDDALQEEVAHDEKLRAIREQRELECFSVVNRGGIWYELLTSQEKTELMDWYQAWLDATETLIIPEKPTWLK